MTACRLPVVKIGRALYDTLHCNHKTFITKVASLEVVEFAQLGQQRSKKCFDIRKLASRVGSNHLSKTAISTD